MRGRSVRTPEKFAALFAQLRLGYSIRAACRAEGIPYRTYWQWRTDDPVFAAGADAAIDEGTDYLEDKARNRAVKQSDLLLIFLLKSRRPEKYRDTHAVSHEGDITIRVLYGEDDHAATS